MDANPDSPDDRRVRDDLRVIVVGASGGGVESLDDFVTVAHTATPAEFADQDAADD